MKIEVANLKQALGAIIKTIELRNTVPILEHVLIEPTEGGIAITAHALDRCATAQCLAVEGEMIFQATTVPGNQLYDLSRALPDDVVELVPGDGQLTVKCGGSRYRLQTLPAGDFPARLSAGDASAFTLSAEDVTRTFKWPAFAVSRDETRYYLEGIFLHQLDECLAAVGTDGHRLVRTLGPLPQGWTISGGSGAIIPRHFAEQVVKLGAGVTIKLSAEIIEAIAGDTTIVSKLIDGNYPDYARLVPKRSANVFECDRKEFWAVASRLKAVAERVKSKDRDVSSPAAGITWKDGAVQLMLARQLGAAEDTIDATVSGTGRVAVKLEYLIQLLEALPGESIRFDQAEASAPIIVTVPENADLLALQMSVRW
jgi:DNA polymerase-3 subunit beta